MNKLQNIFIDEYGDANLDVTQKGVTQSYILTAVIVDDDLLKQESDSAIKIIKKYFPKGELKSSSIGKNINRRLIICNELLKLKFHFYSIVFDKLEIRKDSGLRFKESFIKFLHKQLYETLYSNLSSLNIYSDEHGRSEFMESFENYILDVIKDNLFDKRSFQFVNSKDYPFVQLADFISGSLARFYDSKKFQKESKVFIELIKDKSLRIDEWPNKYNLKSVPIHTATSYEYDSVIVDHAIRQAEVFISKNENTHDLDVELQVRAIKFLLFNFKFISSTEYVSTKVLVKHLSEITGQEISEQKLRLQIIAKLRDANLIIASSSTGYKIPLNIHNMYDFVERTNSVVLPMLERIAKAREQYLFISKNTIDILNSSRFNKLKEIIDK